MNEQQRAYNLGRIMASTYDGVFLATSLGSGYLTTLCFEYGQLIPGVILGYIAVHGGHHTMRYGLRRLLDVRTRIRTRDKATYPLEHAEGITIADTQGLEALLNKTWDNEELEWGTVLRAHGEHGRAVIDDLLAVEAASEEGFVYAPTKNSLRIATQKAINQGYNGHHHFHPGEGYAENFAINFVDRCSPPNWINLLTFKMPNGPEIVGFNNRYTYIPTNHSKRELVRATQKQIKEYLRS